MMSMCLWYWSMKRIYTKNLHPKLARAQHAIKPRKEISTSKLKIWPNELRKYHRSQHSQHWPAIKVAYESINDQLYKNAIFQRTGDIQHCLWKNPREREREREKGLSLKMELDKNSWSSIMWELGSHRPGLLPELMNCDGIQEGKGSHRGRGNDFRSSCSAHNADSPDVKRLAEFPSHQVLRTRIAPIWAGKSAGGSGERPRSAHTGTKRRRGQWRRRHRCDAELQFDEWSPGQVGPGTRSYSRIASLSNGLRKRTPLPRLISPHLISAFYVQIYFEARWVKCLFDLSCNVYAWRS